MPRAYGRSTGGMIISNAGHENLGESPYIIAFLWAYYNMPVFGILNTRREK